MKYIRPRFLIALLIGYYFLVLIIFIGLPIIEILYLMNNVQMAPIWILIISIIPIWLFGFILTGKLYPQLLLYILHKSKYPHYTVYFLFHSKLIKNKKRINVLSEKFAPDKCNLLRKKLEYFKYKPFIDFTNLPKETVIRKPKNTYLTPLILLFILIPTVYFINSDAWFIQIGAGVFLLYDTINKYRKSRDRSPVLIINNKDIIINNNEMIKWEKILGWHISYTQQYLGTGMTKLTKYINLIYLNKNENEQIKSYDMRSLNVFPSKMKLLLYIYKNRNKNHS